MVSIPLTASGQGGATEEDDYSDFPASVSFASGDMSKDLHLHRGLGRCGR